VGDSVAGATPDDVSETNNQEQGVNEGDIVKADDNGVVYILSGRHLVIAKGFPPQEMTTLKQVDLGARGTQLFLDKAQQRLVVLARYDTPVYITAGDVVDVTADAAIYPPIRDWDVTVAIFYDISTPDNPLMLDQIRFKGNYQDGRRIDGRLHLVLRSYYHPEVYYQDQQAQDLLQAYWKAVNDVKCDPDVVAADPAVVAAKAAFADRVSSLFDAAAIDAYLPTAQRLTERGELQSLPFLACSDIQHPEVSASLGLQVIASLDTDGQNLAATAMVNNAWQTYASKDYLYVAETNHHWWWIAQDSTLPTSQTAIYKFAISGSKPEYVATGTVSGYTLNQFNFSEYNGALRIATTQDDVFFDIGNTGSRERRWERSSNVFVLQDDGNGNLQVAGSVRGIGKGETMRSSRFFDGRGFVVTFLQIDPLFTFDLSDPSNPQQKAELFLPGFSEYIHAFDENHIMTIGRSAGAGGIGTGNGIQLQLFDVSDLENPTLLHEHIPGNAQGWSWSEAEYNHKAFTFYKPANLLAIPMQYNNTNTGGVFSGIAAYKVTVEGGFEKLGSVDHADLANEYYCISGVELYEKYKDNCLTGGYMNWAAPRRSLVMSSTQGELDVFYLYTLSDLGMKAADVADLDTTLGRILLPPQPYPWWYYGVDPIDRVPPPIAVPVEPIGTVVF